MYLIRRIYTVKPGKARRAATLIDLIGKAYADAGTRSASRVYFNSGTTPGERNTVVMEWMDETLQTPYRDNRVLVDGVKVYASELKEIELESEIEFWELMTDEKHLDS